VLIPEGTNKQISKDTKMNKLYEELPRDERQEDEETVGDSIAMQFYYGNWSTSVEEMEELNISANDLHEYLKEKAFESSCTLSDEHYYGGWFDTEFFMELTQDLTRRRSM